MQYTEQYTTPIAGPSFQPSQGQYAPDPEELLSATYLQQGGELGFVIRPSEVSNSSVVRRSPEETRRLLSIKQRQAQKRLQLNTLALRTSAAQQAFVAASSKETDVMTSATEREISWTHLTPNYAYALALAVRETAQAKYDVHHAKLTENLQSSEVLRDEVDLAHFQLVEADRQLGRLLNFFETQGIHPGFLPPIAPPASLPTFRQDSPAPHWQEGEDEDYFI